MFYYIEEKKHCLFLDIRGVLLVHVICPLHDSFKDWEFLPQGGYKSFEFKKERRITKVDTHAQGGVISNVFARFFNPHKHFFNRNKTLKLDKFPTHTHTHTKSSCLLNAEVYLIHFILCNNLRTTRKRNPTILEL